jgi:hypothetical protein
VGKLIVLNNDLVLVDFDDPGAVIGEHLVVHFIDDAFILEPCEIIDFLEMQWIDQVAGFVDKSDLDVGGQMAPKCSCVKIQHR